MNEKPFNKGDHVRSITHLGPEYGTMPLYTGVVTRIRRSRHKWNMDVRTDHDGQIIESISDCWINNLRKSVKSMDSPSLITFPARPVNGGRLENAPPKVGPWIVQPKIDDWRGVLHAPSKTLWNRYGEPSTVAAQGKLDAALSILSFSSFDWLDIGIMENRHDMMRGTIIVFDTMDMPTFNHINRRAHLEVAFATLAAAPPPTRDSVFLIPEVRLAAMHSYYALLQKINAEMKQRHDTDHNFYEGIVCKRTDKPYPVQLLSPTKETPSWIKHRFDQ